MNRTEVVARKIKLKEQAWGLIQEEIMELRHLQGLLSLRDFLTTKLIGDFDPDLSQQFDAVEFLINQLAGGPV